MVMKSDPNRWGILTGLRANRQLPRCASYARTLRVRELRIEDERLIDIRIDVFGDCIQALDTIGLADGTRQAQPTRILADIDTLCRARTVDHLGRGTSVIEIPIDEGVVGVGEVCPAERRDVDEEY